MLTADKLKASAALATLTEEQLKAITELSKNDENDVIAEKVGQIHGQYDRDFQEATGLKKPDGVKTYEWLKSDILPKVKSSTDLEKQLTDLKAEKKTLEDKIKNGDTDGAAKQKLADAENLIETLKGQLKTEKETFEGKLTQAQKERAELALNHQLDTALIGKKFKDEKIIPKSIRESYINAAKADIKSNFTQDEIDDGNGGKMTVFRDKAGQIARNPENNLNPFTAEELFTSRIKDVLDFGKKQQGAGTEPQGGKGGSNPVIDLSGAKTQVEADEIATDYLMSKGLTRGSQEYNEEFTKIRSESGVEKLPIR